MGDPLVGVTGAFCVVFAVIVAITAVYSSRRWRRHEQQLRHWADRNGWTFEPHPHVDWGRRLPGGNKHGVGPMFSTVVDARPVMVAEYSVTDGSDGTTTNTHYHVVTVARLHRWLPATELEPRGRASRLKATIFGPGETATGNPAFDHDFRIRTTEPAALRQWLSAPLIAAHLSGQVPSSWSVQGTDLLCHQPGRLDPEQIRRHAAAVLPLADLLDGHPRPDRAGGAS